MGLYHKKKLSTLLLAAGKESAAGNVELAAPKAAAPYIYTHIL